MIKELGYLQEACISILAEDSIAFDTPYVGRFGLSMLMELKAGSCQKHILYDTNSAAAPILHNLKIMEKSLERVDTIFLSHCTGFKGMCRIADVKSDRFKAIHTGTEIRLGGQGREPVVMTIPTDHLIPESRMKINEKLE